MTATADRELVLFCYPDGDGDEHRRRGASWFQRCREAIPEMAFVQLESTSVESEALHHDRLVVAARCDGAIAFGGVLTERMRHEIAAVTESGGWFLDQSHHGGVLSPEQLAACVRRGRDGLRLPLLLRAGALDDGPEATQRWLSRDAQRRWRKGN